MSILINLQKKQKSKKTNVSILFIDLNKFKEISDTLGHEAGDVLLKEAAIRFTNPVRSTDVVFRFGGDEFLILLENINDILAVEKVINSILELIKKPIVYKKIQLSVSIRKSLYPKDASSSDELNKSFRYCYVFSKMGIRPQTINILNQRC